MKKLLVILTMGLFSLFAIVGLTPHAVHSAKAACCAYTGESYSYTDYGLSQSNMLVSYIFPDNTTQQYYINRGDCGGEKRAYIPPVDHPCTQSGQVYHVWTNAGWCSGIQFIMYDKATGAFESQSDWKYFSGGSTGYSIDATWAGYGNGWYYSTSDTEVRTYLVPNGYAGCVA